MVLFDPPPPVTCPCQLDSLDGGPDLMPCSPNFHVPWFTVSVSLVELAFFLYHAIHLSQEHCMEVTDSGPVPYCSVLIYNPYRRYEVSGMEQGSTAQGMDSCTGNCAL